MPQISQISEIFASQLFWLIVSFGLVYVVIGRLMLPKVVGTVELRDRRIAEDLAAAEAARARADEVEEEYRRQTEANHAEALKVTQAAKEQAAREAEARIKAVSAELDSRVGEAEARIRAAAGEAAAQVQEAAADVAREMVAKLAGRQVSPERAAAAVSQVTVHG